MLTNFISDKTPYSSILLYHETGTGKSIARGSKVIMYNGFVKKVEDIKIGE